MVIFFSVTLAISVVGLKLLLVLKRFELRTGRKVFGGMRPFLDRFFHRGLVWVEYIVPDAVEAGGKRAGYALTSVIRNLILSIMRYFERTLESVLSRVREKTRTPGRNREASVFLREVADHKRSLGKEGERGIFEE
jgi:hypothetical protein